MHAVTFETAADVVLAAALDDAGGDTQSLALECRIQHPCTVVGHVVDALAGFLTAVVRTGRGELVVDVALIEFISAFLSTSISEVGSGVIDGLRFIEQVLFPIIVIDDLYGVRGVFVRPVPD